MIEKLVNEKGKTYWLVSIVDSLDAEKSFELYNAFLSGGIKEVKRIYKKLPSVIKIKQKTKGLYLIKTGTDYYSANNALGHKFRKSIISIQSFEKIKIEDYKPMAIEDIYQLIEDDDLTLGDKKIIRDIAVEVFLQNIEFASQGHKEIQDIYDCVKTSQSVCSVYKLEEYGFNIKRSITIGRENN